LRTNADALDDVQLFSVRDPWLYVEGDLWDGREKGSMGAEFFTAKNPPNGAVFTYYLKDGVKSRKAVRREGEIKIEEDGGDTPYPSWDALRAEDRELDPQVYVVIRDGDGNVVRQVKGESEKGLHRSAWDLRLPPPDPINLADTGERPYWQSPPTGPMVLPGEYTARLAIFRDGSLQETGEAQSFGVKSMELSPEITGDRRALLAFQILVAELQRAVAGSTSSISELEGRMAHVRAAILNTPTAGSKERDELQRLATQLADVKVAIIGDSTVSGRNEPAPMSIASRAGALYSGLIRTQAAAGGNYENSYEIVAREFADALRALQGAASGLVALESALEVQGAPWTPGRIPDWSEK